MPARPSALQIADIASNAKNAVQGEVRDFCRTLLRDNRRTKHASSMLDGLMRGENDDTFEGPSADRRAARHARMNVPASIKAEKPSPGGAKSPGSVLGSAMRRGLKISSAAVKKGPSKARSPGHLFSPGKKSPQKGGAGKAAYFGAEEDAFLTDLRAKLPNKIWGPCSGRLRARRLGFGGDIVKTHSLLAELDTAGATRMVDSEQVSQPPPPPHTLDPTPYTWYAALEAVGRTPWTLARHP